MQPENDVKRLLELAGESGKLEADESGYVRFIPSDDEKLRIEKFLKAEIDRAILDLTPKFAEISDNIKTYKAAKTRYTDGDDEILPIPLASIAADQIISWTYNTINRPRPIFSMDAQFHEKYQIGAPLEMDGVDEMGMPMMATMPVPIEVESEEVARRLERGYEFKNRERLGFSELSQVLISDAVIAGIGYAKVCADRAYKTVMRPKVNGAVIDLDEKEEVTVKKKEAVKWYALAPTAVLYPSDEDDFNSAPWIAEKTPISPNTFTARVKRGEYFLIEKDKADDLAKVVSEIRDDAEKDARAAKKIAPSEPRQAVNIMEVQFDWIVKTKEDGEKGIKTLSLVGDWHHDAGKICSIHRNPYDHQERFIVPFWQIKDPHSLSGSCTVGRLKWHQRAITSAAQAEFKNAYHANNFSYWWVPGSGAESYFEDNKSLRIGEGIPGGKFGEDWGVVRAGAEHYSMLPLMNWTEGSADRTSNVSSFEKGEAPPGRTPGVSIAQILQQGLQQPLMFLRTLNDSFVKLMRLRILTERQFQPLGETIPVKDQKTRAILEIPFRYPLVDDEGIDPLENIRIALTAADEALAKEHEFDQLAIRANQWMQYANFVAQVAGPMANPAATPAMVELFREIIVGANEINKEITSLSRSDEERFDLAPAVDALIQERNAAAQKQQMMAAQQQQMGGMGANPNAGAESPMAGAGVSDMGGMQGMAGPPGNTESAQPPTEEGLQPM